MALSSVNGTLSSLKTCRQDIGTGMDVITDVAMDLVEAGDQDVASRLKEMETMILDCAKLDREIECFLDTVQQITTEVSTPETMVNLSARVREQFAEKTAQFSDASLQNHPKVAAFNDSIKSSNNQADQLDQSMEELDEDIAVSQKIINLTCPLTKVDMVKPMKNRKCNHCYDEDAILALISRRHSQNKKCRCPVVGCGNSDVKEADLVPYHPPRAPQRRTQQK